MPKEETKVDESLNELNVQLSKEIKQLELQIVQNGTQIEQLEDVNKSLKMEIQQMNERNAQLVEETARKYEEQMGELAEIKEREINYFKTEILKLNEDNENVNFNYINELKFCSFKLIFYCV